MCSELTEVGVNLRIAHLVGVSLHSKKYFVYSDNPELCRVVCKDLKRERNFASHFVTLFSESLFIKPNLTLILLNHSVASTSEL